MEASNEDCDSKLRFLGDDVDEEALRSSRAVAQIRSPSKALKSITENTFKNFREFFTSPRKDPGGTVRKAVPRVSDQLGEFQKLNTEDTMQIDECTNAGKLDHVGPLARSKLSSSLRIPEAAHSSFGRRGEQKSDDADFLDSDYKGMRTTKF